MKPTLLLALLGLLAAGPASAQIDTTGSRYYRPVFADVAVTSGVAYGAAPDFLGTTRALLLDVYQPAGDPALRRPLIIFAHQGGFLTGSRTDAYMVSVCRQFARLGYVTASIDYRLGFPVSGLAAPADTPGVARAAVRGTQDLRAAVRFFSRDAATANAYRVNPRYVVVGGSSAGAFAALEVGYLDRAAEVPSYVNIAALGGIEGQSGSPGYPSAVLAVLNLSGATETHTLIEPGNAPLCSVHGTRDAVVPYLQGRVGSLLPPKYVYGSGRLHPRAAALGIRNTLRTLRGAGHIPFENNAAYADTAFQTMRDFLRPLLAQPGTVLAAAQPSDHPTAPLAYPVPADDGVRVALPATWRLPAQAELLDAAGRVVRVVTLSAQEMNLLRGGLKAGIYTLRFPGQPSVRVAFQ